MTKGKTTDEPFRIPTTEDFPKLLEALEKGRQLVQQKQELESRIQTRLDNQQKEYFDTGGDAEFDEPARLMLSTGVLPAPAEVASTESIEQLRRDIRILARAIELHDQEILRLRREAARSASLAVRPHYRELARKAFESYQSFAQLSSQMADVWQELSDQKLFDENACPILIASNFLWAGGHTGPRASWEAELRAAGVIQ